LYNAFAICHNGLACRTAVHNPAALELGASHCPNRRLGQDMGFGGFAFALKLPKLLNTNLPNYTRLVHLCLSLLQSTT